MSARDSKPPTGVSEMTRGTKQIATLATFKLMGLAVCSEIARDYVRFQAKSIATIDEAMRIADEITEQFGIVIAVFI